MDYSNIRLFSLMKTKMEYLAQNQDLLSENVANADTPGYQPKVLRPFDFKRLAMIEAHRLKMKVTSPSHIAGARPVGPFKVEKQKTVFEKTPVKNGVALEEQMAKVAYNKNDYTLMTNLYHKTALMFKTAIGNS